MKLPRALRTIRASERALVLAFAAVVASFVASTLFTQRLAARIDAAALAISHRGAPSVQHLASARAELHAVQNLAGKTLDGLDGTGPPVSSGKLRAAVEALDLEFGRYRRQTPLVSAVAADARMDEERARLSAALGDLLATAERHEVAAARATLNGEFSNAAEALRRSLISALRANAEALSALGTEIEKTRDESQRVAYALDALAGVLSLLALVVCVRFLRAQNQLLNDRAAELELFSARVAHDILGPLSPVRMALDLIRRKAPPELNFAPILDRAQRSMGHVRDLVDGLLAFARSGARPEPGVAAELLVLKAVLSDAEPLAAERTVTLLLDEPMPDTGVACSRGVLHSLAQNLVRNAIVYMGDSVRREVTLRAAQVGGRVRVEVEDTGPGLAPGTEKRLFEPYIRGPDVGQAGFGLGLATVKRLAEGHGGAVGVRSEPGQGTTFWFELPAAAPVELPGYLARP